MSRRPWKVYPGFSARYGYTFDNKGTGIPCRSFATEEAAHAAAERMVTRDEFGGSFSAARVGCVGHWWPAGVVDEYRSQPDGTFVKVRLDLLAIARENLNQV